MGEESPGALAPFQVYPEIPFQEYRNIDAVNSSRLNKLTNGSMRHFLADYSTETAATNLGRVYHSLVLTPERFDEEFVLAENCVEVTGRGTRCKKSGTRVVDGEQFCSIHIPKGAAGDDTSISVVNASTWDTAHRMMEATRSLDMADFLLDEAQDREICYVWDEPTSGMRCKALIDADSASESAIVDLKTTRDIAPDGFRRSILRYGYHRQAAFYLNAALNVERQREKFYWIAQESSPPFDCVVYEPGADMISQAAETLYRWLSEIGECRERDEWPGFGAYGPVTLSLPEWMNYEEEN